MQIKTGRTPRGSLKNYPDLQRAFKLRQRIDSGIDIGLEDMSYRELVILDHVNSWISETKNREQRRQIKEMQN